MNDGDVLMDLGKACEVCSLVEFKPIQCVYCKHYFCAEHRNNHDCKMTNAGTVNTTVTCPLCSQVIVIKAGEDTNARVNSHINAGCPDESAKVYTSHCAMKGCTKLEMVPFTCNRCGKDFCTLHRLPEDHMCAALKRRSKSPPSSPTSFPLFWGKSGNTEKKSNSGGKKKYSPSVLRSMEIYKGRRTALGDDKIEDIKRFYLQIYFSEAFDRNSVFVFLDKSWTVGKGTYK